MLHLLVFLPFYDLKQVLVLLVSYSGQSDTLLQQDSSVEIQRYKGCLFLSSQTLKSDMGI